MTTNFPTSLDTFSNPSAGDATNNLTTPHADQHADANDAIEAIEAKIGTGASTPIVNRLLRGTGTGTSSWAQVAAGDYAAGSIVNADISSSAAITPDKIRLGHFSARRSANTAGVTGNGTTYTILFDSEDMDPAGRYATGTGIYTAAATGAYEFAISIGVAAGAAAQTQGILRLVTSARTYRWDFDPYTTRNSASGVSTISVSKVCDMAANDTAYVTLQISGGPGDSAVVVGNTLTSAFSGFRVN